MSAILLKSAREARALLATVIIALLIFEPVLVLALGQFASEVLPLASRFPFLKTILSALVGADFMSTVTATSLITLGLAHPFVFAMVWAFLITTCTRGVVGEIDRGTADLMLSLPLSRTRVWSALSLVWLLAGVPICVTPWVGVLFGEWLFPMSEPIALHRLWNPVANFYALYVAIGALTMLVSSFARRRGVAVAVVLGVLLFSFVLNFVAALVPRLKPVAFIGLLDYYRPLEAVRTGQFPLASVATLVGGAGVTWVVGLVQFQRRDIPAA